MKKFDFADISLIILLITGVGCILWGVIFGLACPNEKTSVYDISGHIVGKSQIDGDTYRFAIETDSTRRAANFKDAALYYRANIGDSAKVIGNAITVYFTKELEEKQSFEFIHD